MRQDDISTHHRNILINIAQTKTRYNDNYTKYLHTSAMHIMTAACIQHLGLPGLEPNVLELEA